MGPVDEQTADRIADADRRPASRRDFLVGSAKLVGGGALALVLAGASGSHRLAAAQDEADEDDETTEDEGTEDAQTAEEDEGTEDAEATDAEATDDAGTDDGGDAAAAGTGGGGQGGRRRRQADGMPTAGVGSAFGAAGSKLPEAIGLAAAGAAAAALLTRRGAAGAEESSKG